MSAPASPRDAAAALRASVTVEARLYRERDHDAPRRIGEELCAAVARRGGLLAGHGDTLWAWLHPALPPLEIGPSRDGVMVRACGWPGGPGYHEAIHAVLQETVTAAETEAVVKDVVGSGGRASLEQAYAAALVDGARIGLAHLDAQGERAHLQLGLPPDEALDAIRLVDDAPGVHTMAGPRDRAWLEAVAAGRIAPRDVFPCWDPCFGPPGPALDGRAELALGRALALYGVAWGPRPPATDRQRALRRRLGAALDRAVLWREELAPDAARAIDDDERARIVTLREALDEAERGLEVRLPGALRSSARARVVRLAGGWTAIAPGHFEWQLPDGPPPPEGVIAGVLHLDAHTRLETLAQPAPPEEEAPLAARAAVLLDGPHARAAAHVRRLDDAREGGAPPAAGFALERALPDGGHLLLGQLAAGPSHLVLRIVVAPGAPLDDARALFASLEPPAPSPARRLVV